LLQSQRVLIVEDEWLLADTLADCLRDYGGDIVGPAPSVAAALELVDREPITAAILDISLGGEKSFPIARALRDRKIPFVFTTGYLTGDLPTEFRDVELVSKPFDQNILATFLAAMLDGRSTGHLRPALPRLGGQI
jgi:DNA-binding response OmpR family regulator